MNKAQIKCLIVFSIFAVIGFGPISPGCLIGMTVVAFRPHWFRQLSENLYLGKSIAVRPDISASQSLQARKKSFVSIFGLFLLDIAPVPVTPVVAFFIILTRPQWFYRLVVVIYHERRLIEDNHQEEKHVRTS